MKKKSDEITTFPWFSNQHVQVRGFFFDEEGTFYHKDELLDKFPKGLHSEELVNIISSLNGNFSVLYESTKFKFSAVDRNRSFPVFYNLHHLYYNHHKLLNEYYY